MLLMQIWYFNYTYSRPLHYMIADPFIGLIMAWPWNMNINENVQPHVDCEMATKYCAILFINLGEYIVESCNNDQTLFFKELTFARFLRKSRASL